MMVKTLCSCLEQLEQLCRKFQKVTLSCQQPTYTISHRKPASADCTSLSADYPWPSGFLCDRQAWRSGTHYRL